MLTKVILEAKKKLVISPYDIPHGVIHHYKVWQNCIWIVNQEGLKVNLEELQIAAWWHDVDRKQNIHQDMIDSLEKHQFGKDSIEKILEIVKHHSYGSQQTSLESKVLYDADKLEYIDVYRWIYSYQAVKDGELSEAHFALYKKDVNERLENVIKRLYFKTTKEEFDNKYKNFIRWAKSEKMYLDGKLV